MTLQLFHTHDGSSTLANIGGEAYHSQHGALAESRYVYIQNGLKQCDALAHCHIIECGLGAGITLAATIEWALARSIRISYIGIEKYPVPFHLLDRIALPALSHEALNIWMKAMRSPWGRFDSPHPLISVCKLLTDLHQAVIPLCWAHAIFHDAFSPQTSPELWTRNAFLLIRGWMAPAATLSTYCSAGVAKRAMRDAGLAVKRKTGFAGKHHMLLATNILGPETLG